MNMAKPELKVHFFLVRICLCFCQMPWGIIELETFGTNFPRPHKLM